MSAAEPSQEPATSTVEPSHERATSTAGPSQERATSTVELLWDLVFVFAITQVTALLAHRPSWGQAARAMIALALVWWAWSAFVWAANAVEADSRELRANLLAATALIFVAGIALPRAFGDGAGLFASAYVLVRLLHLKLYVQASRAGRAGMRAIAGFAVTIAIGMALLLAGAIAGGWVREALWAAALAIDYAGPAWLTRDNLRGLQQVAVAHFADRYGQFVLICLGESIVAVGVGDGGLGRSLTAALVGTAALGLLVALGMWWTYFDSLADRARERLRSHDDPVLAAADSYSYLHLLIVAGIIVYAAGIKVAIHDPLVPPMPGPGRLAVCGGVALYLLGVTAFRLRILGEGSPHRLIAAAALVVLWAAGGDLPTWVVGASVATIVVGLCAVELRSRATERTRPSAAPAAARARGSGDAAG